MYESVSDCNMKQFVNNEEMDGMLGGPVLYDARRTFLLVMEKGCSISIWEKNAKFEQCTVLHTMWISCLCILHMQVKGELFKSSCTGLSLDYLCKDHIITVGCIYEYYVLQVA